MPKKKETKRKKPKVKQLKDYKVDNALKSKKKKRSFGRKKVFVFVMIILAVILAGIVFALLIEFNVIENPFSNPLSQPELFKIEDRCSLIVGQLIHTIESDEKCEFRCKTECEVREMRFHDSEFSKRDNDCNLCDCYCK